MIRAATYQCFGVAASASERHLLQIAEETEKIMSETPQNNEPSQNDPGPTISTNPSERGNANLIYILYLVAVVAGITSIVGVIMAYMAKDQAPEWLRSHYRNQIHIFWKGILYSLVGLALTVVLIGLLVLLAAFIWYVVRTIKGMQALSKGEPYPNPDSWGF